MTEAGKRLIAAAHEAKAMTQAEARRVKPLEWENFEGLGAKANIIGPLNYLITFWRGRGEFEISYSVPGFSTCLTDARFHKTLGDAKAAAQAAYERRILSALENNNE